MCFQHELHVLFAVSEVMMRSMRPPAIAFQHEHC